MQFSNMEKMFFYLNTEWKSPVYEMCFQMKEDIDVKRLKEAVSKALLVFTRMKVKPVIKEDGRIDFHTNENDVPVFVDDGNTKMLGSAETNNYLFRIAVDKSQMKIAFFHALADGKASFGFIRLIFIHYFNLSENEEIKPFLISEEEAQNIEYTESLSEKAEEYLRTHEVEPVTSVADKGNAFFPGEEAELFNTAEAFLQELTWNADEFSEIIHKYNVTPLVFVHTLLAQSYVELYKPKDKVIRCGFAVDMRSKFGSKSLANYSCDDAMNYEPDWIEKPFEEQLELVKASMEKSLDTDFLVQYIKIQEDAAKLTVEYFSPLSERIQELMKNKVETSGATYFISNAGKVRLMKEVLDNLENFYVIPTPFIKSVNYYMLTYKNEGRLLEVKNDTGTTVLERLKEKLSEHGVNCKINKRELIKTDRIDVSLFDKEK